jgi:DNA uptake protein ComE-like DNA-binding protein
MLLVFPGCVVSKSTHQQALDDLQATKVNLDQVRVQNDASNKQIRVLKQSNTKLQEDLEKANNEIASLKDALGRESQGLDSKLKELDRQVKELTRAKKDLAQEIEVQKQRNENLSNKIRRQQKELREREPASLLPPPTPAKPAAPGSPAPEPPKTPAQPTPETAPPPPAPPKGAAAPPPLPNLADMSKALVNINTATAAELSSNLALGKEDSDKLIKHRPYKTKDELVSKAGIAKATADKIRDKITVGP